MTDGKLCASSPSVWRGAAFDRPKLTALYWNLELVRLSVYWQAAPANVF